MAAKSTKSAKSAKSGNSGEVSMKIAVKNLKNETVREIELPESVFGYPYKHLLIHVEVQAYLAGLRAGTH